MAVLFWLSLSVLSYLLFSGSARAEGQGIVISPPLQEIVIGKSGDAQVSLTLTNRTSANVSFRLTSVDFRSLDEAGGVAFIGAEVKDLEYKYGLSGWMDLETERITLPAGQSGIIRARIQNLPSLAPGGHYGAVLFRLEPGLGDKDKNKVAIEQQLGSLIFLKKVGGERYGMDLESISKPKNWRSSNPSIKLKFKNTGNVHVVPRGTAELQDSGGTLVAKTNINPESGILLPESSRKYPTLLKSSKLKPGRYGLQISYRYDGTDRARIYRETIYVFDGWAGVVVGGLALGALAGLLVLVRWIWLRKKNKPLSSHFR